MRTYGFKERLYTQARSRGVVFLRHDEDHKPRVEARQQDGTVRVDAWDGALGQTISIDADLVVLSMPMVPVEGSRHLATTLKVPVDADGWFLEAHVKLRPVEFANRGIFLAGAAHYPKLLDETLAQAQAAASRAATILAQPTLSAGGVVATVNEQQCVGCLTCVRVCPLGIPVVQSARVGIGGTMGAAYIEPTVCQGCGTCVGECPAGAIELLHYRHHQVEQQVLSLFAEAALASGGQVPG
jgi:heterodisulfide reductase subunit A